MIMYFYCVYILKTEPTEKRVSLQCKLQNIDIIQSKRKC